MMHNFYICLHLTQIFTQKRPPPKIKMTLIIEQNLKRFDLMLQEENLGSSLQSTKYK